MDMRKQALEEERRRREELEKRLQEETSRRQKLIDREVKLREKQRAQVRNLKHSFSLMTDWPAGSKHCFDIQPEHSVMIL